MTIPYRSESKLSKREEEDAFIIITANTAFAVSQAITQEMIDENVKLPISAQTIQLILDGLRVCMMRLHKAGMIDHKKGSADAARIFNQLMEEDPRGKTKH